MRKFFLILFLFISIASYSQISNVRVVLKKGVSISGLLKEIDVNNHIIISISGVETTIPMSDIESIENQADTIKGDKISFSSLSFSEGKYGSYEITDNNTYPESFILDLDGQKITMILVRGGLFNMGYDDRHSLSMESEPVHLVELSSFYVSKEGLSNRVAQNLRGLKIGKKSNLDNYYSTEKWEEVKGLVSAVADVAKKPYRMLTEAEWEYTSLMPFANEIFGDQEYVEWCSDFFDEYEENYQINPTGPLKGKQHVTRSYNGRRNKWDRKKTLIEYGFVRIAIEADKIQ